MKNLLLHGIINWKTSITALVTGVIVILNGFNLGIHITEQQQVDLIAAAVIIIGWFSKDSNVSGTADDET